MLEDRGIRTKKKGKLVNQMQKQYFVPILIIVIGIGWLLNVQGVIPKVDWIWTKPR